MRFSSILACAGLAIAVLVAAGGCRTLSRTDRPVANAASDQSERGALAGLRPRVVSSRLETALGRGVDETAARQAYKQGDELFQQASDASGQKRARLFREAAEKYATAARRFPDSMLQENALFMKGEAHFFADEYDAAEKAYEELVEAFPNTRHIDRVDARRFDIAQYWLAVHRNDPKFFLLPNWRDEKLPHNDTYGHAVRIFDKIRLDDPTGRLADDATMAAASAHFIRGEFNEAERFLADLRRTYPESKHQFEAALLGVKAKMKLYQGADYESKHLEEALQLIELTFQQFPEQAAEHREYLENAYKEIRVKLAMRDWEMAQYYDNRAEYGGARHYYRKVLRDFPDTSLAQDAEQRLAEIADRPDKPPQRLEWLVEAIPEQNNQHKPLISGDPFKWLWR